MASFRNPPADSTARNTSFDSVMSGTSAPSPAPSGTSTVFHSHNSSTDTTTAASPPVDAHAYISANGGPTQAVERLLRERQQEAKLWRLLEKQRTMVHGMHADLEKALQEREHYRKRAKEAEKQLEHALSSAPPPVFGTAPPRRSLTGLEKDNPRDAAAAFGASQSGSTTSEHFETPPLSPRSVHPPRIDSAAAAPPTPRSAKSVLSSPTEKSRKAAPAPLNLTQTTPSRATQQQSKISDDSDTSDDANVPELERGRKRTRADDDRHREMVAVAEEIRSRSGKSSKSKKGVSQEPSSTEAQKPPPMSPPHRPAPAQPTAGSTPESVLGSAALPAGMIANIGLPASPRAGFDSMSRSQEGPGSIASVLQQGNPADAAPARAIHLPLKSPGLPMSPRPMDKPMNSPAPRMPSSNFASSGPLSPRGLPLSPRAPKHPIPLPLGGPQSLSAAKATSQRTPAVTTAPPDMMSMAERLQTGGPTKSKHSAGPSLDSLNMDSVASNEIFTGFASDSNPEMLLAPNAIPHIKVRVASSRLQPPRDGLTTGRVNEEDYVLILGVHSRANGRQLWRSEKTPSSLLSLDYALRRNMNVTSPPVDRGLFSGHAPAKLDQRRAALNAYFDVILDSPVSDRAALELCSYLSTHAIEPLTTDAGAIAATPASPTIFLRKEGYLAKKGKQFGGWKSRWFILEEGLLRHYTAPNGEHLGNIRLQNAQVAKKVGEADDDSEYRHFFAILEPKRKDSASVTRHVLCAESDEERDEWVEALMVHIGNARVFAVSPPTSPRPGQIRSPSFNNAAAPSFGPRGQRSEDRGERSPISGLLSVEEYAGQEAPPMGTPSIVSAIPSPSPIPEEAATPLNLTHTKISGPQNAQPIPSASLAAWGNKSTSPPRMKDGRKRSMFGFITRSNDESSMITPRLPRFTSDNAVATMDKPVASRPVFGVPLAEAAEHSAPVGSAICLPSPVYRCIQYLEARNAASEEGIFRLSGSNSLVASLKERFDTEGDFDLRRGDYVDVHAVASLLKRYLRELPEVILTREMYPKFAKLSEIEDKQQRLLTINYLIHKLPEPNREVLVAVFGFLVKVVNRCETNRMNVKNVGIVFAPTLLIPTTLVWVFISEHSTCFTPSPLDPDLGQQTIESLADVPVPASAEELVSPRQQMFAGASVSTPYPAGSGPMQSLRDPFVMVNDPRTPMTATAFQDVRKTSAASETRDAISRPIPILSPNAGAMRDRSQSGDSASPASRSAALSSAKGTPNTGDDVLNGVSNGTTITFPPSAGSSSPNSAMGSFKGWDGLGSEAGTPMARKTKRESMSAGTGAPPSSFRPGPLDQIPAAEQPRKKSSLTRLKEGIGSLRET